MVRKLLIISLLMAAGCASHYTFSKECFPDGSGCADVAEYTEKLESHRECWVVDSTYTECELKCKGSR